MITLTKLTLQKKKIMRLTTMSLLLLSILTFAFSTICASQNTFEFTIKDTLTDQLINDAVALYKLIDQEGDVKLEKLPDLRESYARRTKIF